MKEKDEYYFNILTGQRIINSNNIEIIKFSSFLKGLFFDKKYSKWKPTLYKSYIKRNDLEFNICFEVLNSLKNGNIVIKKKGFNDFLQEIEKYNTKENQAEKIKIYEGYQNDFIKEFYKLQKDYFKVTKKEFIEFIDKNFDTGLTPGTINQYFKAKKFE